MQETFEVVITAIIEKDNKYLILRRSPEKKRFPGMWTVPGGKLESHDFKVIGTFVEVLGLQFGCKDTIQPAVFGVPRSCLDVA